MLNLSKLGNIIAASILVLALLIAIGLFTHIHTVTLDAAVVKKKGHEENNYYVLVDEKKLYFTDEKIWNLVKENETYHIEYDYYGLKEPTVSTIEPVKE